MKYFGIDPGKYGGIALLTDENEIGVSPLPQTESDLWRWCTEWLNPTDHCRVIMEQVSGYIGAAQPGAYMFNFGVGYGRLRMCLVACGLRENDHWQTVHPVTWQRGLGIPPRKRGTKAADHKRNLQAIAQRMYPSVKLTAQTGDAILLAHYCKMVYGPKTNR